MREEIIDFEDLTDSRELIKAREPNFIVIFIYIFIVLLSVAIIWMWFGEIDIVVKANGIARPSKNTSYIHNAVGGTIKSIYYGEGKKVKKGELLYIVDTSTYDVKKETLLKKITKVNMEIEQLKKLEMSIKNVQNPFSEDEIVYTNRFLVYQTKHEQLLLDYKRAKNTYQRKKSLGPSVIPENKLEELETKYNYTKLSLEKHISENIVNIKTEIDNKEEELSQLKQQLADINEKLGLAQVKAPISGTIQVLHKFNERDYISTGIEVLRIIPDTESKFKMEIIVKNKDISQLEKGQEIKYRFLSLPYKEYGVLNGKITRIAGDATLSDSEDNLSYNVEASINKIKLSDKKGKTEYIKPGMLCEARVVVRQKKIFYIVLEKLDFIS